MVSNQVACCGEGGGGGGGEGGGGVGRNRIPLDKPPQNSEVPLQEKIA